MTGKKPTEKGMTDFELGSFLSKLDTKIDGLTGDFKNFVSMFSEVHKHLDDRVRNIEKGYVTHETLEKIEEKHDRLRTMVWKIALFLAASGVGGTALFQILGK